jgi:hypothetical protein
MPENSGKQVGIKEKLIQNGCNADAAMQAGDFMFQCRCLLFRAPQLLYFFPQPGNRNIQLFAVFGHRSAGNVIAFFFQDFHQALVR